MKKKSKGKSIRAKLNTAQPKAKEVTNKRKDWYAEWNDSDIHIIFSVIPEITGKDVFELSGQVPAFQKAVMAYIDKKDWKREVRYYNPDLLRGICDGDDAGVQYRELDAPDRWVVTQDKSIIMSEDDKGNIVIEHHLKKVYKLRRS